MNNSQLCQVNRDLEIKKIEYKRLLATKRKIMETPSQERPSVRIIMFE